MSRSTELSGLLEQALAASGLELVDLELTRGQLRVVVDRPSGVDLDALTEANRLLSTVLDGNDHLAPSGPYALEVSSPGVERPLRRPEHFRRFVGSAVAVRTVGGAPGPRRVKGSLTVADDEGIVVADDALGDVRVRYDDIDRAHTVFDWDGGAAEGARRPGKAAPIRRKANAV